MNKKVDIFGAGLVGFVAAYHLARQGFEVHVYDRERCVGGNPFTGPSGDKPKFEFTLHEKSSYLLVFTP